MCSHIKVWQGCPSVLQPTLAIRSIPCLLGVGLPYLVPLACSVIGWEQPVGDAAPPPTQMQQWLSERSSWGPGHPLPPPRRWKSGRCVRLAAIMGMIQSSFWDFPTVCTSVCVWRSVVHREGFTKWKWFHKEGGTLISRNGRARAVQRCS